MARRVGIGKTTYIGSWLTTVVKATGCRADHIAHGHRRTADPAIDRGADLGIIKIDLCALELCLRGLQLRRGDALRCLRAVDGLLATSIFLQQFLLAPELDIVVLELRLGLRDRGLLDVDGCLERRALQRVKQIALLDVGTFREKLLVQEGGQARYDVDAVDRLQYGR